MFGQKASTSLDSALFSFQCVGVCVCMSESVKESKTEKIMIESSNLTAVSWTYFSSDTYTHTHTSIRSHGELSSSELIGSHVYSLQPLSATDQQYSGHHLTHWQRNRQTHTHRYAHLCTHIHTVYAVCSVRASGKINKAYITTGAKPKNTHTRTQKLVARGKKAYETMMMSASLRRISM